MNAIAVFAAVFLAQAVLVSSGDNNNDEGNADYFEECAYLWMMMNNGGVPTFGLGSLQLLTCTTTTVTALALIGSMNRLI